MCNVITAQLIGEACALSELTVMVLILVVGSTPKNNAEMRIFFIRPCLG